MAALGGAASAPAAPWHTPFTHSASARHPPSRGIALVPTAARYALASPVTMHTLVAWLAASPLCAYPRAVCSPLGVRIAVAPRACNHAMTSVRHRLCMSLCCCARLPSTDVGPSGLRARRGMASPGAVAFALRAARSRRSASFPCWDCAPVSSRGTTAAQAGLTARVILLSGRVRFRVIAGAPFGAPHGVAARPCDRASARNGLLRRSSSLLLSSSVTRAIEA